MPTFNVVHNDGAVTVTVEGDYATLVVDQIRDHTVLVRALHKAREEVCREGPG